MAKITQGLFSFRAYGTIGKCITFQGRRFFNHVHKKSSPRDARTDNQVTQRNAFAYAVPFWKLFLDPEKQVYTSLGSKRNNITGYMLHMSLNIPYVPFWARFGETEFADIKKFGGPLGPQIT